MILRVDGVALGASVLDEFLALAGREEMSVTCSAFGWVDRSGPFASNTDRAGPRGVEFRSSAPEL